MTQGPGDDEHDDTEAEARSAHVLDQIFDDDAAPDARAYGLAAGAQQMIDQLETRLSEPPVELGVYLDTGKIERMGRPELEAQARARGLGDGADLTDLELRELVRASRAAP